MLVFTDTRSTLGLFVMPLSFLKFQYSVFLNRATWPSRKTNCAPLLCKVVWTLFSCATGASPPLSKSQTVAVGDRMSRYFDLLVLAQSIDMFIETVME